MSKTKEIITIYGLDIDKVSIAEAVKQINTVNLPDDQLLHAFAEAIEGIELAYRNIGDAEEAYLIASPIVYEVYRRAYGTSPINTKTLPDAVHYSPTSLRFWANPGVITRIWMLLVVDGFKHRKQEANNACAKRT